MQQMLLINTHWFVTVHYAHAIFNEPDLFKMSQSFTCFPEHIET